jgi:argininosuccinate lyase
MPLESPAVGQSGASPSYVQTPAAPFLSSLHLDRAFARHDLAGSIAHAEMLGKAGTLTPAEVGTIVAGLRAIGREIRAGAFPWRPELEDVHTNVESRLTELIGPLGGKLHTARSRNDQVALDLRLYLRGAVADLGAALLELERTLLARAEALAGVPMPGYTHLQRAQPVTVGHYLLAHFWRFDRDLDRLFATTERANVSPLGAGALAGSTLPIRPDYVAERLGFSHAFENSLDAVSDRDPVAELLFDLALTLVHASGLGEEVVLFATKEFGFVARTPALGSGSSLMPQKRNPDVAELVRGKTGRAVGALVSLLTMLKGLPLAYDRDLQEDKAPLFDAVATAQETLEALATLVGALEFDRARLLQAAEDPELLATDVVEYLVGRGIPFREAHEAVGPLVRQGAGSFDIRALQSHLPPGTLDAGARFDPHGAVERRASPGGPASSAFTTQLGLARSRCEDRATSLSSLARNVERVEELVNEERK